jgi:hypothetical protein
MTDVEIGLAIQEAVEEFEKLSTYTARTKKAIIQQLAQKFEEAGWPVDMISEKIVDELHDKRNLVAKSHINDCLDQKYKRKKESRPENGIETPEKSIEESSKPVVIDTSGEPVDDETDEQLDRRSEQTITDEVNKSMHQPTQQYPTSWIEDEVKKYNKIMMDQAEKIKQLQATIGNNIDAIGQYDKILNEYKAKLKAAEEKTKDSEYIALEQKLIRLEEMNTRLLVENKQYSEAVVKHSFETAANVKVDAQQIKNYEEMITSLELMVKQKTAIIDDLTQKIESFSHISNIIEPQPLELDVHKFVGVIFANRQNKVTIVHDNKKVLTIRGGEI